MTRIFTLFLLLTSMLPVAQATERNIPADSKIIRVIVFLQGAQIEREQQLQVPAGRSTIVFQGLSPEIDEQSIQVRGSGNFTILAVNRQSNFLNEQQFGAETQQLQARIEGLKDELVILQNRNLVLQKDEEMLAANQSIGTGAGGMDLNKLKQALDFQKARLTGNQQKRRDNQKRMEKLNEDIGRLNGQLSALQGKARTSTSDIAVKVNAKSAGAGTFRISYLVRNAGWYPTYDLRASDVHKPMDLIYRANITQQSGEDWKNVRLVLSSGNPSAGGGKPSLRPYEIGYNVLPHVPGAGITRVTGRITDSDGSPLPGAHVRIKGSSIGASADADGQYSIQIPSPGTVLQFAFIGYETAERLAATARIDVRLRSDERQLSEVVNVRTDNQAKVASVPAARAFRAGQSAPLQVEVQQGQTTVQFEVEEPYTIPSDGKQLAVEIGSHSLEAGYRYSAVPKLSENAYLTATVRGISELNLLSGEANIFFEGAYLGKTLINLQEAADTLSVSLGADKNIVIKRVQQKEQNEKSFMGSSQRAVRVFTIEALNRKPYPVTLSIEDQIPVSASGEVSVEALDISGARHVEANGSLNWELQLQPREKKIVSMKYQVRYPKNKPVRLE